MGNMTKDNITKSLLVHLQEKTGIKTAWKVSGMELPSETPFILVEEMQDNNNVLSKGREAVETTVRYQIGLYARTTAQRSVLWDELSRVLLFDEVTYTDYSKSPAIVGGFFNCAVSAEVPFGADELSDLSKYHRVYFDVEIQNIRRR